MREQYTYVSLALLFVAATITQIPPKRLAPQRSSSGDFRRLAVEAYGQLPLAFEANQGQTDRSVKFLARGNGYTLFLTANEAVLTLRGSEPRASGSGLIPGCAREQAANQVPDARIRSLEECRTLAISGMASWKTDAGENGVTGKGAVLRMKLVGANPSPAVAGEDKLPGNSNYFLGNDPSQWRANVPHYARVSYRDVYPGIDLVYYGNQRQLEYDLIVAPGADTALIQLAFEGQEKITIDSTGDLVLETSDGNHLRLQKPLVYQESNGLRQEIAGNYALQKDGESVGFTLAAYDANEPLVIDPVLVYSTYLGGGSLDSGTAIAVDSSGSAYITGVTFSTDFPSRLLKK